MCLRGTASHRFTLGGLYRANGPAAEPGALAADLLGAHLPAYGRPVRDVGAHPR